MTDYKPYLISWNVTGKCNLRCSHCYIDAFGPGERTVDELSTDEGIELIEQIAQLSPGAMLVFTGGEPLLREDLPVLVRKASNEGLVVVVGTNGTLLDDSMVSKLLNCGVRGVGISLDSLNPSKHDAFRGVRGAWEKTMRGISACRKRGLEFQIQTTVTKENYGEIPNLIEYANEVGAKAFNLFFLVCTGRGQRMTDISPQLYERMLSYLAKVQKDYSMLVRARCAPHYARISLQGNDSVSPETWSVGCLAGTYYCRITPEGFVTPCPYLPIELGSIRKDSLTHIWKNSKVLARLQNPRLMGRCGRCEYAAACGGCRARAFAIRGDFMAEDPWCLHKPKSTSHPSPLTGNKREWEVVWSDEAKRRMDRAPVFLRNVIARRVELYALEKGLREVTPELLKEVKEKWRGKKGS